MFSGLKLGSHLFEEEWWYTEDGITSYNGTFSDCENLKTIEIPEGVKYVPQDIFANNSNIKKVVLPKSMRVISENAFANCVNLTEIEGGENLAAI